MKWLSLVVTSFAVAASAAEHSQNAIQNDKPEVTDDGNSFNMVIRPVSYSYFSPNLRDPTSARMEFPRPLFVVGEEPIQQQTALEEQPIHADYPQPYGIPSQEENRNLPVVTRRTVKFPLNTVLPGNSLSFDHKPYPGLLQAVNSFSDIAPSRKPQEGLLVTHNTVSLPPSDYGVTTASRTRISNQGGLSGRGYYPLREFTETTHNTKGDKGSLLERSQHVRIHQGVDEDPAASYAFYKTGHGGGSHFQEENGEAQENEHHNTKGGKGKKTYEKDHKHHKVAKGHRDNERDSGQLEENLKKEKKYHKDEGFYGEHHATEKGGKGKKYGEGGKHKKGHTTHGEHNIIKKDEYIKNTKFYDEDHGGGEHEEHGEFYGQHEGMKGGNEEGKHKESDYSHKNFDKKKYHDKGYEDEEHDGHDTGSGHEQHFEHEEEYGGSRGSHASKHWGHRSGDKH